MRYILDTHVFVWWLAGDKRLSAGMKRVLKHATNDNPLFLSDITLWEVAMLAELGRIRLDRPLREWLTIASAPPLVQLERITPAVAAEVATFPDVFHRDPADRVIVATARLLGARLVTADKYIVRARLVETLS